MSKEARNGQLAFAIVVAVCSALICLPIAGLMLAEYANVHRANAAYQKNAEEARDATSKEIAKSCFKPDFAVFSECVTKEIATYYKDQATNEDLQAQKDMAYWAKALFFLGGLQAIFSAAGVYFIWRSLKLNRDAVEAALRAAEASEKQAEMALDSFRRLERPYLHVRVSDTGMLSYPEARNIPRISFIFTNHGKSPAIVVDIACRLEDEPDFPLRIPLRLHRKWYEVIDVGKSTNKELQTIVEGAAPGTTYIGERAQGLLFHGTVEYFDQMGAVHIDGFCLRCKSTGSFDLEGGTTLNWRKTEYPKGDE